MLNMKLRIREEAKSAFNSPFPAWIDLHSRSPTQHLYIHAHSNWMSFTRCHCQLLYNICWQMCLFNQPRLAQDILKYLGELGVFVYLEGPP